MKKYTPGPWEIFNSYGRIVGERPGIEAVGENRRSIVCYGSKNELGSSGVCGENIEQRIANARLIAAAPDLAESLAALVPLATAFMGSYGATHGFPDGHPEHKAAIDAARAALVKAGVDL